MPDDAPRYETLSQADLGFTIARIFAKRRNRTRHQQALLASTADQVIGEIVAAALLEEGYEVRLPLGRGCGATWPPPGAGPAPEHPAD